MSETVGVSMKTMFAAAFAACLSFGITPNHVAAQGVETLVAKVIIGAAIANSNRAAANRGTSANTHYALTGQGAPERSRAQAQFPHPGGGRVMQRCNPYHQQCGYQKKW